MGIQIIINIKIHNSYLLNAHHMTSPTTHNKPLREVIQVAETDLRKASL